ncbi:MAG: polysaccharide deacetylase family protein [Proteobacteria bacterium]|nr:polysaccharide deacetylase family protein [Pseudomonadota bacterium]
MRIPALLLLAPLTIAAAAPEARPPAPPAAPVKAAPAKPAPARPARADVALTFDDLPGISQIDDQSYVDGFTDAILAGLKRHHWKATGFVNESKLDDLVPDHQLANLKKWLDAGMELGNHTFSHESPNAIGAEAYIDDIAKGEKVTRPLMAAHHKREQWFRHPYLETGHPEAVQRKIDHWLAEHHYRIAPVTMNSTDWMFAEPYDDAIAKHDEARRRRIREQYLEFTGRMIGWYRRASATLFGRDISYVFLFHASRLNGDCIDDLAALFKRHNLRVVPLAKAMKDPAYQSPDRYDAKDGVDWMERWAFTRGVKLPRDGDTDPPRIVQQEYDAVDNDRTAAARDEAAKAQAAKDAAEEAAAGKKPAKP